MLFEDSVGVFVALAGNGTVLRDRRTRKCEPGDGGAAQILEVGALQASLGLG